MGIILNGMPTQFQASFPNPHIAYQLKCCDPGHAVAQGLPSAAHSEIEYNGIFLRTVVIVLDKFVEQQIVTPTDLQYGIPTKLIGSLFTLHVPQHWAIGLQLQICVRTKNMLARATARSFSLLCCVLE